MRLSYFWRIRLVAYGARLESGLGLRPQGFESPILRSRLCSLPLALRRKPHLRATVYYAQSCFNSQTLAAFTRPM